MLQASEISLYLDHGNGIEVDRFQAQGGIYSLLPLFYAGSGDAQAAVDHAMQVLITNMGAFEEAVEKLSTMEDGLSNDQHGQIHCFVEGCRTYCSGNVIWRFELFLFRARYSADEHAVSRLSDMA